MLELAIRGARIDQQTIKDLRTTLAVRPAAMLRLAIRGASMDQQTIKDLPTTLAVRPAAMLDWLSDVQAWTNRRSRTYEQPLRCIQLR